VTSYAYAYALVFVCIVIEIFLIKSYFTVFYYCNLSMYDQNVTTTAAGLQSTLNIQHVVWLFVILV